MNLGDPFYYITGKKPIKINKSLLDKDSTYRQKTLWHEWLHMIFGPHELDVINDKASTEVERIYACSSLCFDGAKATRCACAKCLETDTCSNRCAGFEACVSKPTNCVPKNSCSGTYSVFTPGLSCGANCCIQGHPNQVPGYMAEHYCATGLWTGNGLRACFLSEDPGPNNCSGDCPFPKK